MGLEVEGLGGCSWKSKVFAPWWWGSAVKDDGCVFSWMRLAQAGLAHPINIKAICLHQNKSLTFLFRAPTAGTRAIFLEPIVGC